MAPFVDMADPQVPRSGEYEEGKLWFERKGNILTIGLTNSGMEEIGTVEAIELPSEGEPYEKDDVVMAVEGTKTTFDVSVPGAGTILEVNELLQREPETLTEDPTEAGWLFKYEMQDPSELLDE